MVRRSAYAVAFMTLGAIGIGLTGCCAKAITIYFQMPRSTAPADEREYEVRLSPPLLLDSCACEGFKDLHNEQWASGSERLMRALSAGKNAYFSHLALAVCYEKMGDYDEAYNHYQKAHRIKQADDARNGWKRVEWRRDTKADQPHEKPRKPKRGIDPSKLDVDD